MMSKTVQEALNRQIHSELKASYTYLAMSAWCDRNNWKGAATWMRLQSQEEYAHAMKLFDFMLARHGKLDLKSIDGPKGEFKHLVEVFETAYKQELEVSKQIDALYELAGEQKAYAAMVQLEWFITEQVEEEKNSSQVLESLRRVGENQAALVILDRELGQRAPEGSGAAT
jgi:ferritin